MPTNNTYAAQPAETEAAMSATTITVDLSKTIGQESAIAANGGPLFAIKITCPADAEGRWAGFGKVVCAGPVKGHEVLYTLESVV